MSFQYICIKSVDPITPLKQTSTKIKPDLWLNNTAWAITHGNRKAECRWKKDRLHVSLGILRDCLCEYQNDVKQAKSQYLVSTTCNQLQVLFSAIHSTINFPTKLLKTATESTCDDFLLFVSNMDSIKQIIACIYSAVQLHVPPRNSAVFDQFKLVLLLHLFEVVQQTRPTNCPLDAFLSKTLKQTLGACFLMFKSCLKLRVCPICFQACCG